MSGDLLGRYEELPYPPARTAGIDLFRLAKGRHYVPFLLEIDVTAARVAIRRHAQEGWSSPSGRSAADPVSRATMSSRATS
jgi:hypothetical protein